MIPENDNMPICKEHGERIVRCDPCCNRLAAFQKSMPKVTARPWRQGLESAMDYHVRVDRAEEENRERLHSWAVANVYVDTKLPF
jgi:hypothetical protein